MISRLEAKLSNDEKTTLSSLRAAVEDFNILLVFSIHTYTSQALEGVCVALSYDSLSCCIAAQRRHRGKGGLQICEALPGRLEVSCEGVSSGTERCHVSSIVCRWQRVYV